MSEIKNLRWRPALFLTDPLPPAPDLARQVAPTHSPLPKPNPTQLRGADAGEDPLNASGFQGEHAREEPCEHGAVIGQDGIIAAKKESPGILPGLGCTGGRTPLQKTEADQPKRRPPAGGYSFAICTCAGWKIPAPEICDAIRNAAKTAGMLISLRNWSTESIVFAPKATSEDPFNSPQERSVARLSESGPCRPHLKS